MHVDIICHCMLMTQQCFLVIICGVHLFSFYHFFFQKNRLAELAKTKRLNRHFLDIVEKARWYVLSKPSCKDILTSCAC